jgi:hypothetical protein
VTELESNSVLLEEGKSIQYKVMYARSVIKAKLDFTFDVVRNLELFNLLNLNINFLFCFPLQRQTYYGKHR